MDINSPIQFIQAAGIPRKLAPTIGIAVDPRRQNVSEESLKTNVERLVEFKKRLIVFPRRNGKTKAGDSKPEEIKEARAAGFANLVGSSLPIAQATGVSEGKVADFESTEGGAFRKLRIAQSDARYVGVRQKRTEKKAEEAAAAKK